MSIRLSISLVLYNHNVSDISGLLADISKIELSHRLYIVDNSEQDTDLGSLADENIELISPGKNLGYGKGHNIAIRKAAEAGTECHLVVNPDVRFEGADISELYRYVMSDRGIGLVIPSVYYPDGSFQYIYKMLPNPFVLFIRYAARLLPAKLVEKSNFEYELRFKDFSEEFELPVVSGCFMFGRTEVFAEADGFDERFFMYMEDVDISRRIGERYRNMYYPYVRITHAFGKSSFKNLRLMRAHVVSACKYFYKWGWFSDCRRKRKNLSVLCGDRGQENQ